MSAARIELHLAVAERELDADTLDEFAALLGDELADLDVDEVLRASDGEAPAGSKGLDAALIGALVVKLSQSRRLLGQIVDAVRDWAGRNSATVRMEIDGDVLEISRITATERKALIDAWVQRHGGP